MLIFVIRSTDIDRLRDNDWSLAGVLRYPNARCTDRVFVDSEPFESRSGPVACWSVYYTLRS